MPLLLSRFCVRLCALGVLLAFILCAVPAGQAEADTFWVQDPAMAYGMGSSLLYYNTVNLDQATYAAGQNINVTSVTQVAMCNNQGSAFSMASLTAQAEWGSWSTVTLMNGSPAMATDADIIGGTLEADGMMAGIPGAAAFAGPSTGGWYVIHFTGSGYNPWLARWITNTHDMGFTVTAPTQPSPPPHVAVWTTYCTGGNNPNPAYNWQWWQYDDSTPANYQFLRAGDGACMDACAAYRDKSCASAPNACGMKSTSIYSCDGSCPATVPSNNQCPGGTLEVTCPTSSHCSIHTSPGVNAATVLPGDPLVLAWSCVPPSVSSAGYNFSTGGATSGSVTVKPTSDTTYSLHCQVGKQQTTTVTVLHPSLSITAAPVMVHKHSAATVRWSATNVSGCTVSGPGLSVSGLSGTQTVTIVGQSVFSLQCQTAVGDVSASAMVRLVPVESEI